MVPSSGARCGRRSCRRRLHQPMKMFVGVASARRANGSTDRCAILWLGNQDRLVIPDTKVAATSSFVGKHSEIRLPRIGGDSRPTAPGKMPETTELAAPGIGIKFRLIPAVALSWGRAEIKNVLRAQRCISASSSGGHRGDPSFSGRPMDEGNPGEKTSDMTGAE